MIHKAGIVLPINIEYFKGTAAKSVNTLSWKITCRNTSARIILERGTDRNQFAPIREWNEPQARCLQPFSFKDSFSLPGNNFYRLKTIDVDGLEKYSDIVQLQSNNKDVNIVRVTPSPTYTDAILELSAKFKVPAEITIASMEGKILARKNVNIISGINRIPLETTRLLSGIYIVTVKTDQSNIESTRLIKL